MAKRGTISKLALTILVLFFLGWSGINAAKHKVPTTPGRCHKCEKEFKAGFEVGLVAFTDCPELRSFHAHCIRDYPNETCPCRTDVQLNVTFDLDPNGGHRSSERISVRWMAKHNDIHAALKAKVVAKVGTGFTLAPNLVMISGQSRVTLEATDDVVNALQKDPNASILVEARKIVASPEVVLYLDENIENVCPKVKLDGTELAIEIGYKCATQLGFNRRKLQFNAEEKVGCVVDFDKNEEIEFDPFKVVGEHQLVKCKQIVVYRTLNNDDHVIYGQVENVNYGYKGHQQIYISLLAVDRLDDVLYFASNYNFSSFKAKFTSGTKADAELNVIHGTVTQSTLLDMVKKGRRSHTLILHGRITEYLYYILEMEYTQYDGSSPSQRRSGRRRASITSGVTVRGIIKSEDDDIGLEAELVRGTRSTKIDVDNLDLFEYVCRSRLTNGREVQGTLKVRQTQKYVGVKVYKGDTICAECRRVPYSDSWTSIEQIAKECLQQSQTKAITLDSNVLGESKHQVTLKIEDKPTRKLLQPIRCLVFTAKTDAPSRKPTRRPTTSRRRGTTNSGKREGS